MDNIGKGAKMKIFLNYRQDDSQEETDLIYERLSSKFEAKNIFRDIDKLTPGDSLLPILKNSISNCDVFICVIGSRWRDNERDGTKRIFIEDDYVRMEIETAITLGIRIIPVFIGKVTLHKNDVPKSIQSILDILHHRVNPKYKLQSIEELIEIIGMRGNWEFPKIKVFISYSQADIELAKEIKGELDYYDIDAWLAEDDLQVGKHIDFDLRENINSSDFFLLLISRSSLKSNYVEKELGMVTQFFGNEISRRFIPARLDNSEIPKRLDEKFKISETKYADFSEDFNIGVEKVLKAIGINNPLEFNFRKALRFRKMFFTPRSLMDTDFSYNHIFYTPNKLPGEDGRYRPRSSTRTFQVWLENTYYELNRVSGYPLLGARRLIADDTDLTVGNIENEQINLIAYASSKINPITDKALQIFEKTYSIEQRYVFSGDLKKGLRKSDLSSIYFKQTKGNQGQVSLRFNGESYIRDIANGVDYALIVRGRPYPEQNDTRIWWILSGCGRPAMVAVQELFINPDGARLIEKELLDKNVNWPFANYLAMVMKVIYKPNYRFSPVSVFQAQTRGKPNWYLNTEFLKIEKITVLIK